MRPGGYWGRSDGAEFRVHLTAVVYVKWAGVLAGLEGRSGPFCACASGW